jgi:hypothetical protein
MAKVSMLTLTEGWEASNMRASIQEGKLEAIRGNAFKNYPYERHPCFYQVKIIKRSRSHLTGMAVGYRRLAALMAVFLATVTLAFVAHQFLFSPEAVLRREMEHLRDQEVPMERVYRDDDFGCLVVEFMDMEDEYVQPVREIVGYGQPVLFREFETPEALVGEPPSTPLDA